MPSFIFTRQTREKRNEVQEYTLKNEKKEKEKCLILKSREKPFLLCNA